MLHLLQLVDSNSFSTSFTKLLVLFLPWTTVLFFVFFLFKLLNKEPVSFYGLFHTIVHSFSCTIQVLLVPLLIMRDIIYYARRYPVASQWWQHCAFSPLIHDFCPSETTLILSSLGHSCLQGCAAHPKHPVITTNHHLPLRRQMRGDCQPCPWEPVPHKTSSGKRGIIRKTCIPEHAVHVTCCYSAPAHSHLRAIQACTDLPSTEHLKLEPSCLSEFPHYFPLWRASHFGYGTTSTLLSPAICPLLTNTTQPHKAGMGQPTGNQHSLWNWKSAHRVNLVLDI